jgi:predicted ABC-type ATPase
MILIAGINGAGKTSFYYNRLKPLLEEQGFEFPFINADEIEKANHPTEVGQHGVAASREAYRHRTKHFKDKTSFVTESVYSQQSKNSLILKAQSYGFDVYLHHVHVPSPDIAYKRVQTRVQLKGHHVDEEVVKQRYPRMVRNMQIAISEADVGYVWDNSQGHTVNQSLNQFVMKTVRGNVTETTESVPKWALEIYQKQLKAYSDHKAQVCLSAFRMLMRDSSDESRIRINATLRAAKITPAEFLIAVKYFSDKSKR